MVRFGRRSFLDDVPCNCDVGAADMSTVGALRNERLLELPFVYPDTELALIFITLNTNSFAPLEPFHVSNLQRHTPK